MKKVTSKIVAVLMALMLSVCCAVAASAGPILDTVNTVNTVKNVTEIAALAKGAEVADAPLTKAVGIKVVGDVVKFYFNDLPDALTTTAKVNDALGINLEDTNDGHIPVTISVGK